MKKLLKNSLVALTVFVGNALAAEGIEAQQVSQVSFQGQRDEVKVDLVSHVKEHDPTTVIISATGAFNTWDTPHSITRHPARIFFTNVAAADELNLDHHRALLKAAHMVLDPTIVDPDDAVEQRSIEGYAALHLPFRGQANSGQIEDYLASAGLTRHSDQDALHAYTTFRRDWMVHSLDRIFVQEAVKPVAVNWGEQLNELSLMGINTIFWDRFPPGLVETNEYFDKYQGVRERVAFPKTGMVPGAHVHPALVGDLRGHVQDGVFIEDEGGHLFAKNGFVSAGPSDLFKSVLAHRGINLADEKVLFLDYSDLAQKKADSLGVERAIGISGHDMLEAAERGLTAENELECFDILSKTYRDGSDAEKRRDYVESIVEFIHGLPATLLEDVEGKRDPFVGAYSLLDREHVLRQEVVDYLSLGEEELEDA